MSTNYRFKEGMKKEEILNVLKDHGITENISKDTEKDQFCLTDGKDYIWAYSYKDGLYWDFTRYGQNYSAEEFLHKLSDDIGISFMSEYDEGYFQDE